MSSFEEENLYELVNDVDSEPPPLLPAVCSQTPFINDDHHHHTSKYYILQEIVESERNTELSEVVGSAIKKLDVEGDYEYIEILCEGKNNGGGLLKKVVVDIDFKSQFELARPTSKYKELCDILPSIFVGDEGKLNNIISIVCDEAKHSFRKRGLHLPKQLQTRF
ncbi:hypothetical protein BUALT_Bualt04G0050400 [Buddleja alternifolia]|uniref:Uncharacterized protein n=1 Tax=Buddleja alternifolia TaxID=168488 RepID=A0AAV6XT77_9LAMI|nr:hypothetical protein BUALT_Bualt04G0050400 [Buddleja alternifolia]